MIEHGTNFYLLIRRHQLSICKVTRNSVEKWHYLQKKPESVDLRIRREIDFSSEVIFDLMIDLIQWAVRYSVCVFLI
jgi:hypothetical protein